MARKYSVGPTSGKKASKFIATAPDGTQLKSKSFLVHNTEAFMGVFCVNGLWMASGITDSPQNWGSQIFLKALKIP